MPGWMEGWMDDSVFFCQALILQLTELLCKLNDAQAGQNFREKYLK